MVGGRLLVPSLPTMAGGSRNIQIDGQPSFIHSLRNKMLASKSKTQTDAHMHTGIHAGLSMKTHVLQHEESHLLQQHPMRS